MSSVAKKRATNKKSARDRRLLAKAEREEREGVPVSDRIRRAARRAGLTQAERWDSERVTFLRGDVNLAINEIQNGFEEILEAEFFATGAQRDSLVLSVLRRLRNAETVIGATAGGGS